MELVSEYLEKKKYKFYNKYFESMMEYIKEITVVQNADYVHGMDEEILTNKFKKRKLYISVDDNYSISEKRIKEFVRKYFLNDPYFGEVIVETNDGIGHFWNHKYGSDFEKEKI